MTKEELELRVTAHASEMAHVRHAVCALAEASGACDETVSDIALAVGEACANVVMHAYRGREPGDLVVRAAVEPQALRVEVEDHGGGMVPRPDSSGLGLGLPLMTTVSDAMTIVTSSGGRGTTVRLRFALSA